MAVAVLAAGSLAAQASVLPLEGRDINGNPVAATDASAVFEYDPNLNITWLRNWNVNGTMTWNAAETWAAGLTVGTFGGWMLPTIDASDTTCSNNFNPGGGFPQQYFGYNCTGSDMGYMYYTELLNPADGALSTNTSPFLNMQSHDFWSGTEYAPNTSNAWVFNTDDGGQRFDGKDNPMYAVAVRPGDVAAVPEPATLALVGLGLAGLGFSRRKQ